jgi:hypothetical protein
MTAPSRTFAKSPAKLKLAMPEIHENVDSNLALTRAGSSLWTSRSNRLPAHYPPSVQPLKELRLRRQNTPDAVL